MKNIKQKLTLLFIILTVGTSINLKAMAAKKTDPALRQAYEQVGIAQNKLFEIVEKLEDIYKKHSEKKRDKNGKVFPDFLDAVQEYDRTFKEWVNSNVYIEFLKAPTTPITDLSRKLKQQFKNNFAYAYLRTNLASGDAKEDLKELLSQEEMEEWMVQQQESAASRKEKMEKIRQKIRAESAKLTESVEAFKKRTMNPKEEEEES